jgi:hypothetical protein
VRPVYQSKYFSAPGSSSHPRWNGIDKYLLKVLISVPDSYTPTFDSEVPENFIKADKHHDHNAVMFFLRQLGRARNSNFGLNLQSAHL